MNLDLSLAVIVYSRLKLFLKP